MVVPLLYSFVLETHGDILAGSVVHARDVEYGEHQVVELS